MSNVDTLLAVATGLRATPAELAAAAERLGSATVTVHDLLDDVQAACPPASRPTYNINFRRLVDRFGEAPITAVTTADLRNQRAEIRTAVATRRIETARRKRRPLLAAEVDGLGFGAAANYTNAARFFFTLARQRGLRGDNPAADLKHLKTPPCPERPLDPSELQDLLRVASTTGDDPELDTLIVKIARCTAARREGLINMRVCDLDHRRRSLWLSEKYGNTREIPAPKWLLEEIAAHSASRGATMPTDVALRYRSGRALTASRFSTLFDRLDAVTEWSARLDVGIHWIRHTTLSDIETIAGLRVAAAYAGHSDCSVGVTGRYAKVTFERLAEAHEALFGIR